MLVIRRRAGESFLIGDDVEIEILEVGADHVKLGIAAPKEVSILRKEVHITRQQNEAAARALSPEQLAGLAGKLHR
jgi:carbon storage regulator